MTSELDDGELHSETDAQEWCLLLSSPLGGRNHAFRASLSKTTRDEDSVCCANFVPGFVESGSVVEAGRFFEIRGLNPDEVELLSATHGAVLKRFDDGKVAVVEGGVFSYQGDGDRLIEAILLHGEALPFGPSGLSTGNQAFGFLDTVEFKDLVNHLNKALLLEEKGDVIG